MSKRVLISVFEKENIVEFASELVKLGWEIISTGGTYKILKESGLNVIEVDEVTNFKEILNGRVKTLHPFIHGGILYKRNEQSHVETVDNLGISSIDMVVNNLYPFEKVLNSKNNNTIITIGVVFTLWSASNGIYGIIIAFNNAFRVRDGRIWIVTKIISIIFTVLFLIGMFLVLALVVFGKQLTYLLFHKFNLDEGFYTMWSYLSYSFPILFTFIVFVFLYILGPNLKLKSISILPGAVFSTISWTLVSRLFGYYIDHFSSYIKTYGTIGALMAFIIWLYITGYILIIGAEINAIFHNYKIEHRIFEETHTKE